MDVLEEMEKRLEFLQTQVNERVLDHQLRSEAHQLHELRMSLRPSLPLPPPLALSP